jgi:hypothetical protein
MVEAEKFRHSKSNFDETGTSQEMLVSEEERHQETSYVG